MSKSVLVLIGFLPISKSLINSKNAADLELCILIEAQKKRFILTGSSARKLRRGGASIKCLSRGE